MKTTQDHCIRALSLVLLVLPIAFLLSCNTQKSTPTSDPRPAAAVTSGYAEINSVKLYYEITGEGEPLLLMHGGLGGSEHFDAVIPGLSEHFQVITVDRRGHGLSYDSSDEYSYATMADEMSAFLEHLQIESANMIGFSDGGVVGYHLASTHPDKVKKLVTVGANFRVDGMTEETISFMKNQMTLEGLGEIYPQLVETYRATNPQPENYPEFIRKSRALWLRDPYLTDEKMKQIESPILVLLGDRDAIRIEHALEIRALVTDCRLCVIPDASHFVLMEKPELMLQIVMGFFESTAPPDQAEAS